ncbi:uncharacterized protein LOC106168792 [Lingula anatina]|uniref:Uncharacterized protein LOC106168792 n=1 Tax=Lingula anatina TaxID=7574 RepID=A0A1S3IZJ3_LINAN|nr:uncharacterized protein LOC106168792 [Lingula anatina]|eukprot:XP_013403433.1 uncharacterized protein LOC106168792 [Lingula anatina]
MTAPPSSDSDITGPLSATDFNLSAPLFTTESHKTAPLPTTDSYMLAPLSTKESGITATHSTTGCNMAAPLFTTESNKTAPLFTAEPSVTASFSIVESNKTGSLSTAKIETTAPLSSTANSKVTPHLLATESTVTAPLSSALSNTAVQQTTKDHMRLSAKKCSRKEPHTMMISGAADLLPGTSPNNTVPFSSAEPNADTLLPSLDAPLSSPMPGALTPLFYSVLDSAAPLLNPDGQSSHSPSTAGSINNTFLQLNTSVGEQLVDNMLDQARPVPTNTNGVLTDDKVTSDVLTNNMAISKTMTDGTVMEKNMVAGDSGCPGSQSDSSLTMAIAESYDGDGEPPGCRTSSDDCLDDMTTVESAIPSPTQSAYAGSIRDLKRMANKKKKGVLKRPLPLQELNGGCQESRDGYKKSVSFYCPVEEAQSSLSSHDCDVKTVEFRSKKQETKGKPRKENLKHNCMSSKAPYSQIKKNTPLLLRTPKVYVRSLDVLVNSNQNNNNRSLGSSRSSSRNTNDASQVSVSETAPGTPTSAASVTAVTTATSQVLTTITAATASQSTLSGLPSSSVMTGSNSRSYTQSTSQITTGETVRGSPSPAVSEMSASPARVTNMKSACTQTVETAVGQPLQLQYFCLCPRHGWVPATSTTATAAARSDPFLVPSAHANTHTSGGSLKLKGTEDGMKGGSKEKGFEEGKGSKEPGEKSAGVKKKVSRGKKSGQSSSKRRLINFFKRKSKVSSMDKLMIEDTGAAVGGQAVACSCPTLTSGHPDEAPPRLQQSHGDLLWCGAVPSSTAVHTESSDRFVSPPDSKPTSTGAPSSTSTDRQELPVIPSSRSSSSSLSELMHSNLICQLDAASLAGSSSLSEPLFQQATGMVHSVSTQTILHGFASSLPVDVDPAMCRSVSDYLLDDSMVIEMKKYTEEEEEGSEWDSEAADGGEEPTQMDEMKQSVEFYLSESEDNKMEEQDQPATRDEEEDDSESSDDGDNDTECGALGDSTLLKYEHLIQQVIHTVQQA